jgi:hypothetical protein
VDDSPTILLVTPVWNDSARLAGFGPALAKALAASGLKVSWVIADDGSSAGEQAALNALAGTLSAGFPAVRLMRLDQRSRKGGAVRMAWDAGPAEGLLAFVDADGAVSADVMLNLLSEAVSKSGQAAVVGVRRDSPTTPVRRPVFRRLAFSLFTALTRKMLGVDFADTQCGAKVVPAAVYRSIRPRLKETGFAFDAELLLALREQGCPVIEVPVPWSEQADGKVRPARDAWGMLAALRRIRQRARAGHYE